MDGLMNEWMEGDSQLCVITRSTTVQQHLVCSNHSEHHHLLSSLNPLHDFHLTLSNLPPTIWNTENTLLSDGRHLKNSNDSMKRDRKRKESIFGPNLELLVLVFILTINTEWHRLTYLHCGTASFLLMDDGGGSCSPLSLIGKPCRGQHLISGVNIYFLILQRDLPVGCEMSISRKHETCLVIKMLSN